jgi:citrate lyase beta subunit
MTATDDLVDHLVEELDRRLARADAALANEYPGERPGRQPVHTVYVPADRYDAGLVPAYGAAALKMLDEHAARFASVVRNAELTARVRAKLASEPVEDLRIDFEDGYLGKSDAEEDSDVARAAAALRDSRQAGNAARFGGIRIKSLEAATRHRAVRTLTRFVARMTASGADLSGWVVTLPKVTSVDQVEAMVHACEALEDQLRLDAGSLHFEIQVETPQSILGPDGTAMVAPMVHVAGRRLVGLHYGTYDYSAFCGIAAEQQSLAHPVADHAKLVMQAAVAGTGVRLSDGSTNVLPVGSADEIEAAWAIHHRLVRRSLERGYYQGWDLHPAQLPTRYAATYGFYREGLPRALSRLAHYTKGTMTRIVDEPATARALAAYVLRGLDCGAVEEAEVIAAAGLGAEQLQRLSHHPRSTT